MKEKVEALVKALKEADKAALELSGTDDGGTCNMDSPLICLKGWKEVDVQLASEESGIRIGEKLTSSWFKGFRFVRTATSGQANCRTAMVEAAKKSLEAAGYDVTIWYHMD